MKHFLKGYHCIAHLHHTCATSSTPCTIQQSPGLEKVTNYQKHIHSHHKMGVTEQIIRVTKNKQIAKLLACKYILKESVFVWSWWGYYVGSIELNVGIHHYIPKLLAATSRTKVHIWCSIRQQHRLTKPTNPQETTKIISEKNWKIEMNVAS